jgi:hypothetical protein
MALVAHDCVSARFESTTHFHIIYHITRHRNPFGCLPEVWSPQATVHLCGIFCLPCIDIDTQYKGPRCLVSSDRPSFYSQHLYVPWPGSNLYRICQAC